MTYQPELSIVVLTLNRPRLLKYCLDSVFRYTRTPFELILWDNCSDIPEVHSYLDSLAVEHPGIVRLFKSEQNIGCGIGRANALEKASGRILCTLDSDMNVTPGWDTAMLARLEESDDIAAVSAKIVNPNNTLYSNGGICRELGSGFAVLENLDRGVSLLSASTPPQDCHWLAAGAMMFRREAYLQHPYSKRRYRNCLVEINVCFKLRKAGWRLVNCPNAVAYHFSENLETEQKQEYDALRRNRAVFCQSILYFEDDFDLNTVLSWNSAKTYLGMENPTLLRLYDYFSSMRQYLTSRGGVTLGADGVHLYDLFIIEAFIAEQQI